MRPDSYLRHPVARWTGAVTLFAALAIGSSYLASCASSSSSSTSTTTISAGGAAAAAPNMSTTPPRPDPRVGLAPGAVDSPYTGRILRKAAETAWNVRLVTNVPTPTGFAGVTNSDLAFTGNLVIQGNYNGFILWDVTNPARPTLKTSHLCPASQSDVSVYRNLLFVSGEGLGGRVDCGTQGVPDSVSTVRLRGIRIFDISDIMNPKYIHNVQTCRGSHTHTVVSDPNDANNVYIYVSGSSSVRSPSELPGCSNLAPDEDPNSARFRIEVIQVPLANPTQARIVTSPRIFTGLVAPPRHADPDAGNRGGGARRGGGAAGDTAAGGRGGRGGGGGGRGAAGGGDDIPAGARPGPNQCHDITVYPAVGWAGGACGGYGLLLDIRDVKNPRRVFAAADSNMSFWHSATFSNDGTKVLFTDEWGGGSAPRCRETDKYEWGANALFTIVNNELQFKSYYKMPAAQTSLENCVAHNGSLIPIPGREVMVQGWYQGGISIFDWTDPSKPVEIAFHDRGPLDEKRMRSAGSWSVYWYNGYIYSSEIARGLDVFELVPSGFLTQNEIEAAKTVRYEQFNAQEQPKMVWPPSFALARAYLDQLQRNNGLPAARITAIRSELARAEGQSGQARRTALSQLASQLHTEANSASDQAKAHLLATAIGDLAR
jgi:hypothetical protein